MTQTVLFFQLISTPFLSFLYNWSVCSPFEKSIFFEFLKIKLEKRDLLDPKILVPKKKIKFLDDEYTLRLHFRET